MRYALFPLLCLNVMAAAALDPTVVIPHVADGGSWKTTLKFVNLGTHNVSLIFQFLHDDGTAMSVPVVGNADVTAGNSSMVFLAIKPGQTATIETTGTASDTSSGWALAFQNQSNCCPELLRGVAIYTQHNPGGQDQEATVPIDSAVRGDFALLYDNTNFTTAIAIANYNDAVIPVVAHIRDGLGKEIDQRTILLPKNGHVAFSLPDLWRSTAGIAGSIVFSTSGSAVTAFGLRFNGSAFTTLGPFPLS